MILTAAARPISTTLESPLGALLTARYRPIDGFGFRTVSLPNRSDHEGELPMSQFRSNVATELRHGRQSWLVYLIVLRAVIRSRGRGRGGAVRSRR